MLVCLDMDPSVWSRVLAWYDRQRRDLPWRRDPNPYRVWVSEVMLQQTRVEAVIGPYERFLERFPGIESLSEASIDEVLGMWSGLGYYRRARNLHAGARYVLAEHGGELPRSRAELRLVPGIGDYTAGALLSIAHGLPEELVDGNVERVLTRFHGLSGNPRRAPLKARLRELARAALTTERPGDHNQALMELGALVCTPVAPRCPDCPLQVGCEAHRQGRQHALPELPPRRTPERVRMAALLLPRGDAHLFLRRPDDAGLMAGMWELPTVELRGRVPARRPLEELVRVRTGLTVRVEERAVSVRHAILDRDIAMEGWIGTLLESDGSPPTPDPAGEGNAWAFLDPEGRRHRGISSMYRKLLDAVGAHRGTRG